MATEAPPFDNLLNRQKSRARPIRTYGKRPAQEPAIEAPVKKARPETPTTTPVPTAKATSPPSKLTSSRAPTPELPKLPVEEPAKNPVKGSILNFFKPQPQKRQSSPLRSDAVNSDVADSLPKLMHATASVEKDDIPTLATEDEPSSSSPVPVKDHRNKIRPVRRLRLKPGYVDSAPESSPLSTPDPETPSIAPTRATKKKPVATVVQTTLNLSNKPAFDECRVCGTLYNPLHPPDVKAHNKVHAATLRARKKAEKKRTAKEGLEED